ncbi:hypothetical protein [Andreprevotia chitinilytica]|uniref:hypothetical protein n=1 Tax=Andreprevotia chitinilytica TaxID=396808 RepID=UPI000554D62B|nr:hypothetical protein [Andreprevotia chitinilytica]
MLPKMGNSFPIEKDAEDYAALIALALRTELGESRRALKSVMRWTGASEKTAKNWLAGRYGPNGEHLVALAKHSPAVLNAFLTMTGQCPQFGHSKQAHLRQLLQTALELLQR